MHINKSFVAVTGALAVFTSVALAAGGVVTSSGDGPDQTSACQSAKTNARLAVGSQLQLEGSTSKFRITDFGACNCSIRSDLFDSPANKLVAYICTVDVHYELIEEE